VANENDQATRREQRRAKQQAESTESKAPEPEAAGSPQEIRDRNARLRAKAAADRQSKREQDRARIAATGAGLDAAERIDDIFVRTTHAVTTWIRTNFRWLQWAVLLTVIGMFAVQGLRYYKRQVAAKSADLLMEGERALSGTVSEDEDKAKSIPDELRRWDTRPSYHDNAQRLSVAEKEYKTAIDRYGKTGAGDYARLGLAGVKYDQQKFDEALSLYRTVRASKLAEEDLEVKGRTVEGIGFCLEAKADLEGALKSFRELSNIEGSLEFAVLGLYHQARVLAAQGKKDNAKELLVKAQKRLADDKDAPGAGYFKRPVQEALALLDPGVVAAPSTPDLSDLLRRDPARLQQLLNGMKRQGPGAPAGDAPSEQPE
jgi:predicted negative regulator of RcsB-dependent stress response